MTDNGATYSGEFTLQGYETSFPKGEPCEACVKHEEADGAFLMRRFLNGGGVFPLCDRHHAALIEALK